MNDHTLTLFKSLNSSEAIVRELPAVGKRSELKIKTEEILRLTEMVRQHAHLMEVAMKNEQYAPDLTKLWSGIRSDEKS